MRYSIAIPTPVHCEATAHLLRRDGQEDLCFALWYPSCGSDRRSALVREVILPADGDRAVHGNASFSPQYLERAIGHAMRAGAGLALLHSHLGPGWQDVSLDDIAAERDRGGAVMAATGLPFVGMTLGTDGAWSGRFWDRTGSRHYERRWCETVRVVGERLAVTYDSQQCPVPSFQPILARTISAWGKDAQAHLARLRIGIIGAGSVGCFIAEALVRMGVGHVRLMDFDSVAITNLDRLLHAYPEHVNHAKVKVLAQAIRRSATATNFVVDALEWSVVEADGFRAALDCDVLFSCVDRPWPRHALNTIAYAHLIPVIDGGLQLRTMRGNAGLRSADWRAHVAAPTRCCLECLGQYSAGLVSTEQEGRLDDPKYVEGLHDDHFLKHNENVFAFSMSAGAAELLQFLSLVIAPLDMPNIGAQVFHFVTGTMDTDWRSCHVNCFFPPITAKGDRCGVDVTGRHLVAEAMRTSRTVSAPKASWWRRLWRSLRQMWQC
jgi:hypothetical protein